VKVVCIDDAPPRGNGIPLRGLLSNGETYTVIELMEQNEQKGYRLLERPIFAPDINAEGCWSVSRFVLLAYFEAEFQMEETIYDHPTT
jgi:hypothetical protein